MSKKSTLTGEEISALMGDAQDAGPRGTSGSARPFPFGAEIGRPTPTLPAIDRLNERLARRLRGVIEPLARAKPKIAAAPTVIRNFGDWQAEQPEFTSLSLYSFKPMKGPILLKVEPEFISRMVDAFYGGSGFAAPKRGQGIHRHRGKPAGAVRRGPDRRSWPRPGPTSFRPSRRSGRARPISVTSR